MIDWIVNCFGGRWFFPCWFFCIFLSRFWLEWVYPFFIQLGIQKGRGNLRESKESLCWKYFDKFTLIHGKSNTQVFSFRSEIISFSQSFFKSKSRTIHEPYSKKLIMRRKCGWKNLFYDSEQNFITTFAMSINRFFISIFKKIKKINRF